ncbi:MAG: hypothetical protein VKL42_21810 [Snowella sp.]|nr:hypothetical protein [Snowella sp.]
MINRQKLMKLFLDKQTELDMTQEQFAEWFSNLGGKKVSHGFIQTMTSHKKTSTPEWDNMKTIAKMWNVTLDELNFYLENDEITDIKNANALYKETVEQTLDLSMVEDIAIKYLGESDLLTLGLKLVQVGTGKMREQVEWAKKVANIIKTDIPS